MRPSRILGSLCLLLLLAPVAGAEYTITDVVFLPRLYYVGDRVEVRILLRYSPEETPAPPEAKPLVEWGDIHDISTSFRNGVGEVRLSFTAFTPGTQSLPTIAFGTLRIGGIDVFVQSILESDSQTLAPPRNPVVLPGTRFAVILMASIVVGVPLLWFLVLRRSVEWMRRIVIRYKEGQPYRRLVRDLKQLTQNSALIDGRRFYITLGEDFRRYLSRKTGSDYLSATTGEVSERLADVMDEEKRQELVQLLHYGDLVKFADRPSSETTRRRHVEVLRDAVKAVEFRRRRRVAL